MKASLLCLFIYFATLNIASAEPVCVVSDRATMRKGPGMAHPVTWIVNQFMPLMRGDRKGGWSEVQDLEGVTHWIPSSQVSSRINCVVVRTKTASLRKEPSPQAARAELALLDRYTPLKKIDRDGEWILVQDDFRGEYWVNENNVWIPLMRTKVSF